MVSLCLFSEHRLHCVAKLIGTEAFRSISTVEKICECVTVIFPPFDILFEFCLYVVDQSENRASNT